jgi:hypothetical protein
MTINRKKLRRRAPQDSTLPPWIPIPTRIAASLLGVHKATLLRWVRDHSGAPQPEPRGKYVGTGRSLWWLSGKLEEWYEAQSLPADKRRSFETICEDWKVRWAPLLPYLTNWPQPRLRGAPKRRCPCGVPGCQYTDK